MSGICSRHQGYSAECKICNAIPPTKEALLREIEIQKELRQRAEKRVAELEAEIEQRITTTSTQW